jgi:hypothetical protein
MFIGHGGRHPRQTLSKKVERERDPIPRTAYDGREIRLSEEKQPTGQGGG